MTVARLIRFHYWLKNSQGEVVDTSEGGEPMTLIEGCHQVIPGLEQALLGRAAGERLEVAIPPAQAYGEHRPELVEAVRRAQFPSHLELSEGMTFQTGSGAEAQVVKVVRLQGDWVVVDANHPLAGLTLDFSLQVVEARPARDDEIPTQAQ